MAPVPLAVAWGPMAIASLLPVAVPPSTEPAFDSSAHRMEALIAKNAAADLSLRPPDLAASEAAT